MSRKWKERIIIDNFDLLDESEKKEVHQLLENLPLTYEMWSRDEVVGE